MIKNVILDIGGVFFDDKHINVEEANKVGIKSFVFNSIDDIKNNI